MYGWLATIDRCGWPSEITGRGCAGIVNETWAETETAEKESCTATAATYATWSRRAERLREIVAVVSDEISAFRVESVEDQVYEMAPIAGEVNETGMRRRDRPGGSMHEAYPGCQRRRE